MIIFDTETTGLPKPKIQPLSQHPEIIEFAAIKVDFKNLEIIEQLEFMCKPVLVKELPAQIIKITGITDKDLRDKKPFKAFYPELCELFLGETDLVAHNINFDEYMLWTELERIDKVTKFPWPNNHICTVEKTMHLQHGKRSKLDYLVEHYLGRSVRKGAHRAMVDVMDLYEVVKCMRSKNLI